MTNNTAQLETQIQEVAKRIKALREDMNLSQEMLAKKIGLSAEEYEIRIRRRGFFLYLHLQDCTGLQRGNDGLNGR